MTMSSLFLPTNNAPISSLCHSATRNFTAPSSVSGRSDHASPAAETPLRILLGQGLGVAFLRHSTTAAWSGHDEAPMQVGAVPFSRDCRGYRAGSNHELSRFFAPQEEQALGTIVVFEPPGRRAEDIAASWTTSLRCANVHVGGWNSFTMRNALWPCTLVPTRDTAICPSPPFLCLRFRRALSAHVLFNDEEDGFRITWIDTTEELDRMARGGGGQMPPAAVSAPTPNARRPSDIVAPSDEAAVGANWEEVRSDPESGHVAVARETGGGSGLHIAFEAYLRVDALLSDIVSRRRTSLFKKSPYEKTFVPDFFYNLVSATPDSCRVVLVIVFSNKEKMMRSGDKVPPALGIFVEISLFDQSYSELKWVQHPSCSGGPSMKKWCDSLALNWRMKECRVGVFCLESDEIGPRMEQWVGKTHEGYASEDADDDVNVDLWGKYVEMKKIASRREGVVAAPKNIAMASLYPHCDVVTNEAVCNAIPVKRIASCASPIELVYG